MNFQKCCNACKLGFEIRNVVKNCKNSLPSFDQHVVDVVNDCCEFENTKKIIGEESEMTTILSTGPKYEEAVGPKFDTEEGSGVSLDETAPQTPINTHNFETRHKHSIDDFENLPTPYSPSQASIEIISPQILTSESPGMCSKYISLCNEDETCYDTENYYACICKVGFNRNPKTSDCDDINECTENSHKCKNYEICINEVGSYACEAPSCENGFKIQANSMIDYEVKCVDIDECVDEPCGEGKTCSNTEGSYECKAIDINSHHCEKGFELEDGECIDINECKKGLCGDGEICTNLIGSHRCQKIECERGYAKFLKR